MNLILNIDNRSSVPLHRQLYEQIRESILSGRLSAGVSVPSTRTLAVSLGISRSTVTQSYEQLISEGYLQSVVGSGTKVSERLPDELLHVSSPKSRKTGAPGIKACSAGLSRYGENLAGDSTFEWCEPSLPIQFQYGIPALDEFPLDVWRRLLMRQCRAERSLLLDYASTAQGDVGLRAAIAGYLARSRATRCSADQVIIVNGSQQAIDLVTRVLIDRGERVAVENPGYLGARRSFLAHGAVLQPVPVDESGIIVEQLPARSSGPTKLAYVTPSHQFPTGAVLSLPRRLELIAWAADAGALIVEDDYDSEFRYSSRPIAALQGLDENESVIYAGTFSKILFPSLRIGYLIVPPSLVRVFVRARWLADRHTPTIEQRVLADFIADGHFERHLRRMRTLYDRRRWSLTRALKQHFGDRVTILGENAGMHLMARLQTEFSDEEVVRRARQAGVGIVSARIYYVSAAGKGEFVFGYANLSERKIQEGVRRLANALKMGKSQFTAETQRTLRNR